MVSAWVAFKVNFQTTDIVGDVRVVGKYFAQFVLSDTVFVCDDVAATISNNGDAAVQISFSKLGKDGVALRACFKRFGVRLKKTQDVVDDV